MAQVPAADTQAAGWVQAALRDFAVSVVSLVPEGFASYVRVFHPLPAGERWADIARRGGAVVHPRMQFERIAPACPPGEEPRTGHLEAESLDPLAAILARHTATPDRCWFAVWDGWGRNARRDDVLGAPWFGLPSRGYHLMTGPLTAASESECQPPFTQSPSLWWPDDRAWLVATEVDLDSTYVGCSEACAEAITASGALEAMRIDPASGISNASDELNG